MTGEDLRANLSPETVPGSDSTSEDPTTATAGASTPARGLPDRSQHGTADPGTLPHQCRCGVRWSGNRTCHCGACHHTVSGVSTFDAHRRNGQCLHPADVGLSLLPGRAYECWGTTDDTQLKEA